MKKFSIVVPIYYNELNIPYTLPRLQALAHSLTDYESEFVFVDDGSGDRSLELLLAEQEKDNRIKVVRLSRNFGSMAAIQAGLSQAVGDCVGITTSDLQDPPELFVEMIKKWKEGKKVVMAVRTNREESFFKKLFAGIFYRLLAKYALPGFPHGGFDFVVIDRQVSQEIVRINEKNTHIMSLIFWLGHDREFIPYVRQKREHGRSRWTLAKKVKLFIDSFVSFSYAPIRFISSVGILVAAASFLFGSFVIASALLGRIPDPGYPAIMSAITFFLGLVMVMLGIIGEYLWRILDEARRRPPYVIDKVFD